MNEKKLVNYIDSRQLTDDQIREQYKLFENILEALTHPFYVIDVNTYIIKIANSATKVFGKINENTTCFSLTHNMTRPCHSKSHACPIEAVKNTKKSVKLEHIHFDKNGEKRHVEIYGYPIFDKEGNVVQMIEYSLDITSRKMAEAALQKAHDELESRVEERTAELNKLNKALQDEIEDHKRTEKKMIEYQQQLRSLASQLTLSEEHQRRRIATDLHDSVGQALAITKIKLLEIEESINNSALNKDFSYISELLEQAIQNTRTLTFELSPTILYELDLDAAIEWLIEQFQEQHNFQITYKNSNLRELNNDILIILFRGVRELLMNIAKHAKAQNAHIEVKGNESKIEINISDDGIGFDVSKIDINKNFGIFNLRERLNYIGGGLNIKSEPGRGTKITLTASIINHSKNIEERK